MGYWDNILSREVEVVKLDGNEKTWIGGIYCPPAFRGDDGNYLFVRCISADAANGKEIKLVTLQQTNGSYRSRYWTNLPEFWDNHAIVKEAPETLWKYKHCDEVFESENILDDWLEEDGEGYFDDGFTKWEGNEFEEACQLYVENRKEECKEISFKEWVNVEFHQCNDPDEEDRWDEYKENYMAEAEGYVEPFDPYQ